MERLSISSFDPKPRANGFLWVVIVVGATLVAVETGLRLLVPMDAVPYQNGAQEYRVVRADLKAMGAADVSIIGSSRAREGILAPTIREMLAPNLGDDLRVANYAISGARASEVNAIARILLEGSRRPRIVLYGLSPFQLRARSDPYANLSLLWDLRDWWIARNEYGSVVDEFLPQAIRTELRDYYYTFRYREQLLTKARAFVLGRKLHATPVNGALTRWQRTRQGLSLATRTVSDERVKKFTREYADVHYPDKQEIKQLYDTIGLFQTEGIPIVLFEIPISKLLQRHLPDGVYTGFKRFLTELSKRENLSLYRVEDLGVEFTDKMFLEQSHLNYRGASVLTNQLIHQAILSNIDPHKTGQ